MDMSEEIKLSSVMPEKLDVDSHNSSQFRVWLQRWNDFCQLSGIGSQVG